MKIFILLVLLVFANSESVEEEEEGDQYFGVPLGALHFSSDGTSAEIYAADEFTVIFNHFYHNPRHLGCTAMMIGPPRKEDKENVVEDHGVVLAPAHPPVAARYRTKRQTNFEQFLSWPVEFDHLLMEASPVEKEVRTNDTNNDTSMINEVPIEKLEILPIHPTTITATTISNNQSVTEKPTYNNTVLTTKTVRKTPTTTVQGITTTPKAAIKEDVRPLILFGAKNGAKQKKLREENSDNVMVTSSGETYSFSVRNNDDVRRIDEVRRAPARTETNHQQNQKEVGPQNGNLKGDTEKTTVNPKQSTSFYYVIKDPREQRRQRLIELRRRLNATITTTTKAPEAKIDFDSRFLLPMARDMLATFTLTNGAKITQYKWIGVYDQCLKRHISLVSLRDIDPPREEKIMPLSGWSHNVSSFRVHILNCNTLLIPGFTYDNTNTTSNTYFYAGIGDFPNSIEMQTKATIVGTTTNEPLRSYNGEDILLRLPKGYRTFDIDFVSIYNTDEQKSYGHVIIPSLLVPPCADD